MPMKRGATPRATAIAATGYATAIGVAEASIAYWDVSLGALVHGVLLLVLVNQFLFGRTAAPASGDAVYDRPPWADAALALALLPLLRLLSLTMTVPDLPPTARYAVVGAPLLAAALLAVHIGPFRNVAPRLSAWSWRVQAPIALTGIPLGLAAFAVAERPDGLVDGSDWGRLALGAAILLVFTGFAEELLFRGVLQEGLTRVLGGTGPAAAALLFGCTYLGTGPAAYAAFVTAVGFAFGWFVRRTGSLLGVSVAHGLMNIGLLLVWPLVA
jgi:membrane protease YdiL (CAAX protease family)